MPVAKRRAWLFISCGPGRLTFIESLCSVSGTVARCWRRIWLKRAAKRAVAGQPPRRLVGGSPLGGRAEGRGTTRKVVAGDAQRHAATDAQAAKRGKHRRSIVQMNRNPGAGVLKMLRSPDLSGRSLTEKTTMLKTQTQETRPDRGAVVCSA